MFAVSSSFMRPIGRNSCTNHAVFHGSVSCQVPRTDHWSCPEPDRTEQQDCSTHRIITTVKMSAALRPLLSSAVRHAEGNGIPQCHSDPVVVGWQRKVDLRRGLRHRRIPPHQALPVWPSSRTLQTWLLHMPWIELQSPCQPATRQQEWQTMVTHAASPASAIQQQFGRGCHCR